MRCTHFTILPLKTTIETPNTPCFSNSVWLPKPKHVHIVIATWTLCIQHFFSLNPSFRVANDFFQLWMLFPHFRFHFLVWSFLVSVLSSLLQWIPVVLSTKKKVKAHISIAQSFQKSYFPSNTSQVQYKSVHHPSHPEMMIIEIGSLFSPSFPWPTSPFIFSDIQEN